MKTLIPFSCALAFLMSVASYTPAQDRRIVFLAGKPSHGYGSHEHLAGSRILADTIQRAAANIQCDVYPGGWPADEKVLEGAHAIVMYADGGGGHPALAHLETLGKFIDKGVGFACLHYAVEVPKDRGGPEFLKWLGGYFETHWSVNPHWDADFKMLPDHPATRGVKPFVANDEWYFHMRFQPDMKGVTPLLTAIAPESTMSRADGPHSGNPDVRKEVANRVPQHVAWVYERPDGGRSFGFTGGHYHWNWGREDILKLACNAICWTAKAEIPTNGLAVNQPTFDALKEGQDEPIPGNLKVEEIKSQFKLTGTTATTKTITAAAKVGPTAPSQTDSQVDPSRGHRPEDAVAGLTIAPGLEATLTASEPNLLSLTNLDIDHRGRIWVCEVVNYRRHNGERPEGDRILILEDTDHDGKADASKVYYQGRDIDSAMGICVLGNKVIVSASPNVWIFTDEDGDDKPDRKDLFFSKTGDPQHDHSAHSFLFGPDGKLYWNFGNTGHSVHDAAGKIVVDKAGNEVREHLKPYTNGMPFRCNMDGSEFEVLGYNFRNNYEVTVDSFGALWQSDNDDDGNRATRINFVMEFGNYGYVDQMTGESWRAPRTNMESEIPLQHWHLNDPGVVPTMLITGAGSPTGITVYEGDLLPEVYRNQVIHCDAGPNVVRAYPATNDGAGYKAEIANMMVGERDQWFRPADVCVAPDGSLFVTDWYDPGVGGHNMQDMERGRLFRVATPGKKYQVPKFDFTTAAGAVDAMRNPCLSVRYMAWEAIQKFGDQAIEPLKKLAKDENPRMRARALWALGKLKGHGEEAHQMAIQDRDANVRMMSIRLARQLNIPAERYFTQLVKDTSPQVRRELAVALRFDKSAVMPSLWSQLAMQHDGKDRWYLEALGIGAELRWPECLSAYLRSSSSVISDASRDIIWRSRAPEAAPLIAKMLLDPKLPASEVPRLLRSLDFHAKSDRTGALTSLVAEVKAPNESDQMRRDTVVVEALLKLQDSSIGEKPELMAVVERVLGRTKDRREQLRIVQQLGSRDATKRLIDMAMSGEVDSASVGAFEALVQRGVVDQINALTGSDKLDIAGRAAEVLSLCNGKGTAKLLTDLMNNDKALPEARAAAAKGLTRNDQNARGLIAAARAGKLPNEVRFVVGSNLRASRNEEIRNAAIELFPSPKTSAKEPVPPMPELLAKKGDPVAGEKVFKTTGTCANCHVVRNQGKVVGPDLSEIGSKLTREAMFVSVLDPSAGISHNYESYMALMDSGQTVVGVMVNQAGDTVVLKDAQAIERTLKKSEIEQLKKQEKSIMPENLIENLSTQDLVDVVEYMLTLKKPS
jgi:putative membrane-bound dehydrogenase-like protein